MRVFKTFGAAAAMVLIAVLPGEAQHRGGGGHARTGGAGATHSGGARVAVPRSVGAPRGVVSRNYGGARMMSVGPRSYSYGASRVYAARSRGGVGVGRAVPRGGGGRVAGASYGSYRPYPYRFYRPYYAFRPRLSLGFGLWVGFPVAYSYAYYDPFIYASPYGYPYPYGYSYPYPPYGYGYPAASYPGYPTAAYPPSYPPGSYPASTYPPPPDPQPYASVGVQQSQANTGGVSFEMTPSTAEVFVDGSLVGTVGEFTPTTQPLGLAAGRHHIELRASGYRTMAFDVDIVAGQVIPYRGALQP